MSEKVTYLIRRATGSDAAGVLDCLAQAFEPFRTSYTPQAFLDTVLTREALAQRLKTMSIFVAIDRSGNIIGTIACSAVDQQEGHLRGMAVLPTWQGAAVAKSLLEQAESELRERKCSRVTLDTTAPLQRAIRFYERYGYQPTGKVVDFFGMELFEYDKRF